MTLADAVSRLNGKAVLDAQDALLLRQTIYGAAPNVTRQDIETLFRLNAGANSVSPEWRSLFVEAATDLVVHQQEPEGFVDDEQANWLIAQVSRSQRIREDEVELLIHVLEQATQTPERLSGFVLDAVKGLALSSLKQNGRLDRTAVENLKRVIFAQGGDRNVAVTRREAEALFDVNDAAKGATTDPVWRELFVHAVATCVLYDTPWMPDARAEHRNQEWLADTSVHPFRTIASAFGRRDETSGEVREGFAELLHWDFKDHALESRVKADEALEARAEVVTDDEAHWLMSRIGRTGEMDANERALMAFIRANARAVSPGLDLAMRRLDQETAPAD